MKLRWPSPALVISIVALVVACAGTGYAATIISSTTQIKNGVVKSADIGNGSVQNIDIKKNTISETRLSARLLKKIGGGAAPAGGTVAYEAIRKAGPENQPKNVVTNVATLNVPAGAYVITANTIMTAFTGTTNPLEALFSESGSLSGTCMLDAGGVTHSSSGVVVVNDRQAPATLSMQLTRTVGAPTDIRLMCASAAPWRLSETSIIATKVDNLTLTETTG